MTPTRRTLGRRALAAYRAQGADPPFGDPRRAHSVGMEGYYWRITEPRSGTVVVALCGVSQARDGPWGTAALAAHPGGFLREGITETAEAATAGLGVVAPGVLRAGSDRLELRLGEDARLEARFDERCEWPHRAFGGLGLAQSVPGLGQYWHPHLLGARVTGRALLEGREVDLTGATAYGEKNWGAAFPRRWWWGQAHGFDDRDTCVAFAGGVLERGPLKLSATAIVVRLGDEVLRFSPPAALVRASAGAGRFLVEARGARHSVRLEGDAPSGAAHRLPVPVPSERRTLPGAEQHLAARVRLEVRRGRRLRFADESRLAGLELGET